MASKKVALGLALGLVAATSWADAVPEAVSPGLGQEIARVAGVCPTFSWSGVRGARAYDLVVYEAEQAEGEEARPVISVRVPGAASSWTPSVGSCLEPGIRYAWFVRTAGTRVPGEWSAVRIFEVESTPTLMEVEQALRLLQRHLEARGLKDARVVPEAAVDTGSGSTVPTIDREPEADPRVIHEALGGADFSIDEQGNVAGASFSGDGSGLTGVVAATASALAADGSDCPAGFAARGVDTSGNAEACFDATTQAEMNAHDHDDDYVDTAGDTMTGPLTLQALQPQLKLSTLNLKSDLLFQEKGANRWSLSWSKGNGYFSIHDWLAPGGTRLVIDDDTGNVGIGTSNPGARLDVGGLARVGGSTWPSSGQGMELGYSSGFHRGFIQVYNRGSGTWGELYLGDGRVSIGTLPPGAKLDVRGVGTTTGGVSGYPEVTARFKQTVPGKHSAIAVDALTGQDPVVYLSENGQARWGIRSNSDTDGKFELRHHAGGGKVAMSIATFVSDFELNLRGHLIPTADNSFSLGRLHYRWQYIYLTNPPIVTSDGRMKTRVRPLGYGLPEILRLRPVSYIWKDSDDASTRLGLIAQEVEPLIPEVVWRGEDPEDRWALTYESLTPVLIKAIQDQQEIIEDLQRRIESLEEGL